MIKYLKLKNFRNHLNREITFDSGVNGIIGTNGSGKSRIVEAIKFACHGSNSLESSKEEVISLGHTQGSVTCGIEFNGQEVEIHRNLHNAEVEFTVNGKLYKKSSDVDKFWEDMQFTKSILDNVIIAQQGQIPLLFNGSSSEREPVFQKIFLVPDTNKLRRIIYDQYIKLAPPIEVVENIFELEKKLEELKGNLNFWNQKYESFKVPSKEEIDAVYARKFQLEDARSYSVTAEKYEKELAELNTNITSAYERSVTITEQFEKSTPLKELQEKLTRLSLEEAAAKKQRESLSTIEALQKNCFDLEQYNNIIALLTEKRTKLSEIADKNKFHQSKIEILRGRIKEFSFVKNNPVCPTCRQPLQDIKSNIELWELEIGVEQDQINTKEQVELTSQISQLEQAERHYNNTQQSIKALNGQLDNKDYLTEEAYKIEIVQVKEIIENVKDIKNEKELADQRYLQLSQDRENISDFLHENNHRYIAPEKIVSESTLITEQLGRIDQMLQEQQAIKNNIAISQLELDDITRRILIARKSTAKNDKRNHYLTMLQQVYDALHTTEFPRKLIRGYANVVTELLNDYLSKFKFAYTASVNDNFGIDVLNSQGLKLPIVSGGQQVVIGLSLRLALHELFGQSFPLMIIDEGTTHLDQENKELYFELIKVLKQTTQLKQIIIIDHETRLSNVVDNVIEIK